MGVHGGGDGSGCGFRCYPFDVIGLLAVTQDVAQSVVGLDYWHVECMRLKCENKLAKSSSCQYSIDDVISKLCSFLGCLGCLFDGYFLVLDIVQVVWHG